MLGLLILHAGARAQSYYGYQGCGTAKCHPGDVQGQHEDILASFREHGHPWVEIPTEKQPPGADQFGFTALGVTLVDPATYKKADGTSHGLTWDHVVALLGFHASGAGYFIRDDGKRISNGSNAGTYPPRCFRCHNPTGYAADNTLTMYGLTTAQWANGVPALDGDGKRMNGVQCEHCHGKGLEMSKPDGLFCRDCHSRTDPDPFGTDVSTWDYNRRIPFAPTADGKTGVFTNHHPQGDEFRRSPHKDVVDSEGRPQGCILCHDPHKSVWKDKGGVKFDDDPGEVTATAHGGVGNMCTHCHKKRVRGAMGTEPFNLECIDCHMPEKSGGSATKQPDFTYIANDAHGHRRTHLFRINPNPEKAIDNYKSQTTVLNGVTTISYFWKSPGPDPNAPETTIDWARDGDASLTLDMVCYDCHHNMTIQDMADYAKAVHRQPGMVDLFINESDTLKVVGKNDRVSVDFSIEAGDKAGLKAQWWVICQGPKGWSSWNGKKWVGGLRPWRKSTAVANVPEQNVLKSKLPPGYYTYWVSIDPTDGSENFDSVPVYVKRR
jgi:mono/diheme cytochrome c family protein